MGHFISLDVGVLRHWLGVVVLRDIYRHIVVDGATAVLLFKHC